MKRISILKYSLYCFVVFYWITDLTLGFFGYSLEIVNYSAFSMFIALASIGLVVLSSYKKHSSEDKIFGILLLFMVPISAMNVIVFLLEEMSIFVAVCMLVSFFCSFCMGVKYGRPPVLRRIGLILSGFLFVAILCMVPLLFLFGEIGQITVVQTIRSPEGTYYAEVIDGDQGALGGDTFVNVYEEERIDTPLFEISKSPKTVYRGPWGDYKDMEIYWKNENCLVVNAVEHRIR